MLASPALYYRLLHGGFSERTFIDAFGVESYYQNEQKYVANLIHLRNIQHSAPKRQDNFLCKKGPLLPLDLLFLPSQTSNGRLIVDTSVPIVSNKMNNFSRTGPESNGHHSVTANGWTDGEIPGNFQESTYGDSRGGAERPLKMVMSCSLYVRYSYASLAYLYQTHYCYLFLPPGMAARTTEARNTSVQSALTSAARWIYGTDGHCDCTMITVSC